MSPQEAAARAAKVVALQTLVGKVAAAMELEPTPETLANSLTRLTQDERNEWARAAGVTPPSPNTWARLVWVVRNQPPKRRPVEARP